MYVMCAVRVSQDQLGGRGRRSNSIVADTGSDALVVDCTNARQFVIGSPHTIKLNQFFDKVRACCITPRFECLLVNTSPPPPPPHTMYCGGGGSLY